MDEYFRDGIVIDEISASTLSMDSLCRLLEYRDNSSFNKQDREEALHQGPNEALARVLDFVKREKGGVTGGFRLLECLRVTSVRLDTLNLRLPISRTIIWIVPSPQYAAVAVNCIQTNTKLNETFLWGVMAYKGFLCRRCSLFLRIDTELILVFPHEEDKLAMREAVQASLDEWGSKCSLMVFSGLGCGKELCDTVLHKGVEGLVPHLRHLEAQKEAPWSIPMFEDLNKERSLFYQMLWFGRLVVEDEKVRRGEEMSPWLQDLEWSVSESLTGYHEHILERNLSDWRNGELVRYMKGSRLWVNNDSCLLKMLPIASFRNAVLQSLISSSPPPITFSNPKLQTECTHYNDHVLWFLSSDPKVPLLVCAGINQIFPGISTPELTKIATINSCNLAIECILYDVHK